MLPQILCSHLVSLGHNEFVYQHCIEHSNIVRMLEYVLFDSEMQKTVLLDCTTLGRWVPCQCERSLTHWGRATHICVSKLPIIDSDNGLSPGWRQAITWTNGGILLTGPLGTNLSEILSKIHTFSFKKMHLKTLSAKWRPFCLGLNVLNCNPVISVEHVSLSNFTQMLLFLSLTYGIKMKLKWLLFAEFGVLHVTYFFCHLLHYVESCWNMLFKEMWHTDGAVGSAVAITRLILGLCPANERRHYKVTPSLIGWAQTYNQPCIMLWLR